MADSDLESFRSEIVELRGMLATCLRLTELNVGMRDQWVERIVTIEKNNERYIYEMERQLSNAVDTLKASIADTLAKLDDQITTSTQKMETVSDNVTAGVGQFTELLKRHSDMPVTAAHPKKHY